jgi:hypothetical protein
MSYFIFLNNLDNVEGTLYKIAENQSDLNNLNISQSTYKIIEESQSNFDSVKFGNKCVIKYSNNTITFADKTDSFANKEQLKVYIDNLKNLIKKFTEYNQSHPLYSLWNNYFNQLNNLNLNTITYPLNKSLEQYFNDLEQPSYNILQLP